MGAKIVDQRQGKFLAFELYENMKPLWDRFLKTTNKTTRGRTRGLVKLPMIIFGKTKSDWKVLELHYRREWICFVVGFIIGVIV